MSDFSKIETCTSNIQDTTYYPGYYPGGCPACDPPRCPLCGRKLSPWEPYPYYPPYIGDRLPHYEPWTVTWGGITNV